MDDNEIEYVLVVDGNKSSSNCALEQLSLHGYKVKVLTSCSDAKKWIPSHACLAILIDFHVNQKSELDFMTWVKAYKKDLTVIAMLEDQEEYEASRNFCDVTGNIPLYTKDFAVLEAIDHLERVGRAS